MTEQQMQVALWMEKRQRTVRYQPVEQLSLAERYSQLSKLIDALWEVGGSLSLDLGRKPTIFSANLSHDSATILQKLTVLNVELHATYHMCGLAAVHSRGIYQFTTSSTPLYPSDYQLVIDDTYESPSDSDE